MRYRLYIETPKTDITVDVGSYPELMSEIYNLNRLFEWTSFHVRQLEEVPNIVDYEYN